MARRPDDPILFWGSVLTSRLSDVPLLHPPPDVGTQDDRSWVLLDEIDAMSVALARLKERYNFIHGKLKLPTEVLEHIFAHAALNEMPGQGKTAKAEAFRPDRGFDIKAYAWALQAERKTYEILGWVKLTHVCRAWRAIALAERNRWLWTTMDTGRLSATGMTEIMKRSHPLPITLTMTLSFFSREICTSYYLLDPQYLPRLKSARIVYDERIHHGCLRDTRAMGQAIISTFVRNCSQMLELLAIEHDEDDDYVLKLPLDVPMPLLRHLKLKNAQFNSSITTYPQLTHLEVTTGSQEDFILDSIDKFIVFLRGCPNLQILRLTRTSPWATSTTQDMEEQHVDLPNLTELYLTGSTRDCAHLGCFLDIPKSCSIVIEAPAVKALFPHEILGPMLRRWIPSPVRLDIYSGDDGFSDGVKAWHTDGGGFHDSPSRLHLLRSPCQWMMKELLHLLPKQFSPWETIYDSISLEHLVYLQVHARSERDKRPVSWRRLLQGATAAQHVRVEGRDAIDDLICLLGSASPPAQQPHKQDDKPLYPGLQSLSIRSFDHVALVEKHGLRDCLQARRDAGVGDAMMNVQFEFPDGMVPPDFEASLAELNGLATFQIKTYH